MARIEMQHEHLTDYERAICYYTIPRVTEPLTYGLIVVYTVCLLEAVFLLAYGLIKDSDAITRAGTWALAGIVVLGIVSFLVRAFLNEVKQRKALAVAKGVPDAISGIGDIPDPFASHVLLRHPLHRRGDAFLCTDNSGTVMYSVESSSNSAWWKVKDVHDNKVIRVRVGSSAGSFLLASTYPARLEVYQGSEIVARLRRRFSLAAPTIQIDSYKPEPREFLFKNDGIYFGKRVIGRVFYMHHSLYLDIEKTQLDPAILALFVTMT